MLRQHRRLDDDDDDDSPFDARGVIKDGRSLRVPLFAMDSMDPVQRAIAQSRITDAAGTTVGLHRPGFRVTDTKDARAAVEEAYRLRDEDDRNAWRTGGREGAENSICTVRNAQFPRAQGAPGHIRNGICVPDDEELRDALPARDGNMADVYAAYDARIREMWRNP